MSKEQELKMDLTMPDCLQQINNLLDIYQKGKAYQEFAEYLKKEGKLNTVSAEKLVSIAVIDLKDVSYKYPTQALIVIASILDKIKKGECSQLSNLFLSVEPIINYYETIARLQNTTTLKIFCVSCLKSYPEDIIIEMVKTYRKNVLNVIEDFFDTICAEQVEMGHSFLLTILKALPAEERDLFVKHGIDIWFRRVIPSLTISRQSTMIDSLEVLTDSLVKFDYAQNQYWLTIFEKLYKPERYPRYIQSLLEQGVDNWYRIWIVCIKLLKSQITNAAALNKNRHQYGSPINAMLPVVELAFKMESIRRCQAFLCWDALTDNFYSDFNLNDGSKKRIKLLAIPLKSNNAKVEATANAKFNTWWRVITKFVNATDDFTSTMVMPFLHFCFGKSNSMLKLVTLDQFSNDIKVKCIQALAEITGHLTNECCCCISIPRLKNKQMSTPFLVDHFSDMLHSLETAVKMATDLDTENTRQYIECIWKSTLLTIGELPENNIRKDMFCELLKMIERFTESPNLKLINITVSVLIYTLYTGDTKIRQLIKTKDEQPCNAILLILMKSEMEQYYNSKTADEIFKNLKPFTKFLIEESVKTPDQILSTLLINMEANDNNLILWSALSESLCQSEYDFCAVNVYKMLLWPLQNMVAFSKGTSAKFCVNWYILYQSIHPKVKQSLLDDEILKIISLEANEGSENFYFTLCASISLLNNCSCKDVADIQKLCDITLNALKKAANYKDIEIMCSITFHSLKLLIERNLVKIVNIQLAKRVLMALMLLSKFIVVQIINVQQKELMTLLEEILQSIDSMFIKAEYVDIKSVVLDEITDIFHVCEKGANETVLFNDEAKCRNSTPTGKDIKYFIQKKLKNILTDVMVDDTDNFKAKNAETNHTIGKSIKEKKKFPSIVDKIVENGEEYVVVKNNWKFNPRKLSESQKEKILRKRENIPALYQDLSQSQDEFRMSTWKIDSQDETSSSKSTSVSTKTIEEVAEPLQNAPCTNVGPITMKNILRDTTKTAEKSDINVTDKVNNEPLTTTAVKRLDSPRLALKDRVLRNVRALTEKTSSSQTTTCDINKTLNEGIIKTPESKTNKTPQAINSAPPKINSERPIRQIKVPKKFNDSEMLLLKKPRCSSVDKKPQQAIVAIDVVEVDEDKKKSSLVDKPMKNIVIPNSSNDFQENQNLEPRKIAPNDKFDVDVSDIQAPQSNNKNFGKIYESHTCDVTMDVVQEVANKDITTVSLEKTTNQDLDKDENSTMLASKKRNLNDGSAVKKKRCRITYADMLYLIDTVEGHPLNPGLSKRMLRNNSPQSRLSLASERETRNRKKSKDKSIHNDDETSSSKSSSPVTVVETQDRLSISSEDVGTSEDIIESSQDTTITTTSVKSTNASNKKSTKTSRVKSKSTTNTQDLLNEFNTDIQLMNVTVNQESKDDIELPKNKTMVEEKSEMDLTENMDTQVVNDMVIDDKNKEDSSEVIIVNDDVTAIVINTEETVRGDTQEIAEANTQPVIDLDNLPEDFKNKSEKTFTENKNPNVEDIPVISLEGTEDLTTTTPDEVSSVRKVAEQNACSPLKGESERNKDFLNNTLEISPIKTMSPERRQKSPSPETSSDYVTIKLSSPVNINGEPLEKCDSPEIFTEEKMSPDKRDQSPPRAEPVSNTSSPSSSLSLKKNRPQVRSGRAAHMLGLCTHNESQPVVILEKYDLENSKKGATVTARRNLKNAYNTKDKNDNNPLPDTESENSENFLKFKKPIPTADCSPSGPILKRKLDMVDDVKLSPANKRKRVSFHDPPVSTTVAVQKYIEPLGVRSPQNSALKKLERQSRVVTNAKSQRRLDSVFKLDTVLIKAVESFEDISATADDTVSSIEQTPAVELVKTSDLNDTDPICPELLDCNDPIDIIAAELSSPAMKILLVKELEGKVKTIGDLAKMTELEVNRLCIKAPKVKVASKVLNDYALKRRPKVVDEIYEDIEMVQSSPEIKTMDVEIQTCVVSNNTETQTCDVAMTLASTQTDACPLRHTGVQTIQSGYKSTTDIIASCLSERSDFIERLSVQLDETQIRPLAENLSFNSCLDLLMNKADSSNYTKILDKAIGFRGSNELNVNPGLAGLRDYVLERYSPQDLILFCSQLLQKIHERPFKL